MYKAIGSSKIAREHLERAIAEVIQLQVEVDRLKAERDNEDNGLQTIQDIM